MKSAYENTFGAFRQERWPDGFSGFGLAAGAVFLALILGALSTILPPLLLVMTLVGLLMIGLSVAWPYLGLLSSLILVFDIVPEDYQPGLGKLRAYDAMVVFLTIVVVFRALAKGQSVFKDLRSLVWPMGYLFIALSVSFVYVKYYAPNEAVLSEGRAQFMWLLLPLMVLGIDSRERFKYFLIGTITIGVLTATYASLESLFNVKILSSAAVQPLDFYSNTDIVRTMTGGGTYILILALFLCVNLMLEKRLTWLLGIPLTIVLCLGLAVQYGRGVWIATMIGLLVSAKVYRGWGGAIKVAALAVVALALFLGALSIVKPRVAEALVERATGIGDEIQSGGSFGFRKMENRYAAVAIDKHPFLGVGIGGQYKPTVTAGGGFNNETTYIHNSWLWFPLKMGLWAFFIPFVFIIAFYREIYRGMRAHSGKVGEARWFVGAVAGAFIVPIVTSYTQPEWGAPQGISALATIIGCALLYVRWGSPLPGRPAR